MIDIVSIGDPVCIVVCAQCARGFTAASFESHMQQCKKETRAAPRPAPRVDVYQQPHHVATKPTYEKLRPKKAPQLKSQAKISTTPVVGGKPSAYQLSQQQQDLEPIYREQSGRAANTMLEQQYAQLDHVTKAASKDRSRIKKQYHLNQDQGYPPAVVTPEREPSARVSSRKRRRSDTANTLSPDSRRGGYEIPEAKPRLDRMRLATEFDCAGGHTGARVVQRPPPPGPQPLATYTHPVWRSELRMHVMDALNARGARPSSSTNPGKSLTGHAWGSPQVTY